MKFEKITENKIKIFLNLSDLQKENIDYHSFMSNSPSAQNLFLSILKEADLKLGFNTDNCKLIIETLSVSNEVFIFTITKQKISQSSKKKLVSVKRKYPSCSYDGCIYEFKSIDDYIDFYQYLKTFSYADYSLYFYKQKYYLFIDISKIDTNFLAFFYNYISEFANFIEYNLPLYSKILEYGKCMFNNVSPYGT